jgi:hypothetical protein
MIIQPERKKKQNKKVFLIFKHAHRYCPARWIRPKIGSFDRSSLKREAGRFFRKIHWLPIL